MMFSPRSERALVLLLCFQWEKKAFAAQNMGCGTCYVVSNQQRGGQWERNEKPACVCSVSGLEQR